MLLNYDLFINNNAIVCSKLINTFRTFGPPYKDNPQWNKGL